MRSPVNLVLPLAALMLAGTGTGTQARSTPPPPPSNGPAADYPVTVGDPFTIGTTTWTPADQLNYDAVGEAVVDADGLVGVAGAHKTLPLPSYVEVTALDSGRTILVRLTQRGPMMNDVLLGLSTQAAQQLGIASGAKAAVRVRRVNPPEVERAALRAGGAAPERMATPESLLKVLRRKLADQSPLLPPPSAPPPMPKGPPIASAPASLPAPAVIDGALVDGVVLKSGPDRTPAAPTGRPPAQSATKPARTARVPAPAPAAPAVKGSTYVQVAAFSTRDRAEKVATQLGGRVAASGRYWRVQLGPFRGSGEAAPALEKAKGAGYRDARIQRAD